MIYFFFLPCLLSVFVVLSLCFLMSSLFFIISLFLDFRHLAFSPIFHLSTSFCSKELLLLWLQFHLFIIYFIFHLISCIFSLLFALNLISSLHFLSSHLLFTFILITSLHLICSLLISTDLLPELSISFRFRSSGISFHRQTVSDSTLSVLSCGLTYDWFFTCCFRSHLCVCVCVIDTVWH